MDHDICRIVMVRAIEGQLVVRYLGFALGRGTLGQTCLRTSNVDIVYGWMWGKEKGNAGERKSRAAGL